MLIMAFNTPDMKAGKLITAICNDGLRTKQWLIMISLSQLRFPPDNNCTKQIVAVNLVSFIDLFIIFMVTAYTCDGSPHSDALNTSDSKTSSNLALNAPIQYIQFLFIAMSRVSSTSSIA